MAVLACVHVSKERNNLSLNLTSSHPVMQLFKCNYWGQGEEIKFKG